MNYLDKNQQNIQKEVETEFKTLDNKWGVFRDDGEILAAGVKVIDKYINEIKKSQENYWPWALEKFIQLQQEFIKAQNSLKWIRITSSNTNRKLINDVAHKIDNAEAEVIRRLNLNKETKRVDTAIKESQNTTKKNFFEKQSDGSLLLTKDTNKPKIQEVLGSLFKNESWRYEIDYSECTNSNIKNKMNALIWTDTCWIQYNQTTWTYNLLNSEGRIISHRAYVWEWVKIKTEKQIAFQATSKKLDQINKSIDYTSMADKSWWEATPAWAEKIKLIPDILKTKLEKQSLLREFMIKSEERLDNIVREQKKLWWELDLKNPISKTWISGGLMEVHFVSKDALKKEPFFNKDMISKDLYSFLDGQESNLKTYLTSRLEQKREQFEHFTKREDAFEGTTGPEKQWQEELEKFTTELERKQYNVGLLNALINSIEKKYGVAKTALWIDFRAQSTLMDLKKKSRDLLYTLESKNPTTEEWGKIQEEITTLFINYLGKEHKGWWNFDAQIKEFMWNVFNWDKKKAIEGIRRLGNSLTMLDNSLSGFLKDEIMNDWIEEAKSWSPEAIAIENKEYDKIFKNIYTKLKLDVAWSLDDEWNLSETETKKLIDGLYAQPGARELFEYLKQQGLLPKNIEFSDKKVWELTNNLYETLKNKKNNSENFTITSEQFLKEYEEITLELEAKENKTDDEIAILQSQKVLLQNPDLVESLVSEKIKRTQAAIKYGGIDKDVISTFGPFLIEKWWGLSSWANKDIYNDMIWVGFWNLSDESIEVATEMAKILAEEVVFMVIVMVLLPTGAGAAGVISARVAKRGKRFASRWGKLKKGKTSLTMAKMTKNSKSMTNIANKMGKVWTKIWRGVERYGSTVALGVGRWTLHTALATTYRWEWDKSFKEHVVYALQNMSMYWILWIVGKSAESWRIANLFSKWNKVVNPKKINATRFFAEELLMNPADMMINFSFGNQPLTKEELATNIALWMVFEMIASIKLPWKIKPEPITDMVLYKENVSINGVEISHTQLPVLFEANKAQIDLKKAELQEGGAKRKIKQEANRKTKDFNENKIVELESQKKKLIDGEIQNNKLLEQQKNNLNDLKDLISRDKNTINDHIKEIDKLKDIEKGKRNWESIEAKANDISQYRESYYRDFAKESHPDLYNRFQKALLDNNQLELQKLDIELGERLILDNSKSGKILYDDKWSWKNIETRARESKKLLEKQWKYKWKIELVAESGWNRGIYILDDEAVKSINKINTAIKTIKKRIAANEKAVIDLEEQIIKNSSDWVYKQQLDKFNQEIDDLRNENAKLDEEHRALEDEENSQYAEPKAETTSDIKEPEAQISPDVKANPTSDIKVESIENESLENFEKRIFEEFSKYKNDPEALKKLYREYAKIYHPDRGWKEEMFKILDEINKSFTKWGEQYKFRESSASKNAPAEHVREQPESFTKNNSFDSWASNVQETMSRVESFGFWLWKNAVGPSMERYKNAFNWLRGISIPDKKIKETMSKLRSSFQEKTKLLLKKFDRLVTKDSPKQKIDNDISALSKLIKDRESEYQKANYIWTQEEMRLQIAAFKKYHQYLKKYGADREVYRKRDENIIRDDIFDKKAETKAKTESETKTNQPTSEAKAEKSRNSNPKDVFYRSKKDTNIEANRSLEEILHDDFDEKILSPAWITIDWKNYRLEFRQNMTQNTNRKWEIIWVENGKVTRSVKSETFVVLEGSNGNAIKSKYLDLRAEYVSKNLFGKAEAWYIKYSDIKLDWVTRSMMDVWVFLWGVNKWLKKVSFKPKNIPTTFLSDLKSKMGEISMRFGKDINNSFRNLFDKVSKQLDDFSTMSFKWNEVRQLSNGAIWEWRFDTNWDLVSWKMISNGVIYEWKFKHGFFIDWVVKNQDWSFMGTYKNENFIEFKTKTSTFESPLKLSAEWVELDFSKNQKYSIDAWGEKFTLKKNWDSYVLIQDGNLKLDNQQKVLSWAKWIREGDVLIIGRENNVNGRFDLSGNRYMSREHFQITMKDGKIMIVDLNTLNKTTIEKIPDWDINSSQNIPKTDTENRYNSENDFNGGVENNDPLWFSDDQYDFVWDESFDNFDDIFNDMSF